MSEQQKHTFEERVRFVAKYYQENIFDAEQAWRRFAEKRNLRHFPRWIWQAAAVVLLALGGFAYFMIETQRPDWVAVATGVGELKEVLLPDSSTVSLAGGTELKYDARSFGGSERRVKLSGKAFFQVKHLEEKPFRVEIRESDVTVLGTSFLVRELPQELNVEVLTGRVRFKTGEGLSVIVEAGQAANYVEGATAIQVDGGADVNALSWKTHELIFQRATLPKVVRDVENCYGVSIQGADEMPDSLRLTATFQDLPLEEVLSVINQTLDTRLHVIE